MMIAAIVGGVGAGPAGQHPRPPRGHPVGQRSTGRPGSSVVFYLEVVADDDISLSVAGAALASFGSAKVLHDVTGFLERPDASFVCGVHLVAC